MPAPPTLRYSPTGGKPIVGHRRGLGIEDGFMTKEKEENLELFSELQERETEDFLINFPDDFDKTFSSKLKNLSDVNLETVVKGESSELLNVDAEKHDYDWLMTPPETPLFPALDDEGPANGVARGRPRVQPVSISRSSTRDKSCRSSRGSPSPNRLSHSPRSVTSSTSHSKGIASISPSSSQRSVTPFRGPSSPKRTSPSAPRSSTPSSRRIGSTHGTSPVRGTRGSPKVKAWQSNIHGFSSEAPPNLKTSLADRPGSYCRGSSPARNSKDIGHRRKSTSPASRQFQEGDLVPSPARRSLDIGCDDDFHSPQENDQMWLKKPVVSQGNRSPLKKGTKTFSASSLPKRSFESPIRLTECKKTPPNMFRPLLSSAPTSTLYGNKPYFSNHSIIPSTGGNNDSDEIHSLPTGSGLPEDDLHSEKNVGMNLALETPNHEMNSLIETHILCMDSKGYGEDPHDQEGIDLDPAIRTSNIELHSLGHIHSLVLDSKGNGEDSHDQEDIQLDSAVETSNRVLISLGQTHMLDSRENEEHPEYDKSDDASFVEATSIDCSNSHVENKDDSFTPHIPEEVVTDSEEMNKPELYVSNDLDCLKQCIRCGKKYPSAEFIEEVNLCINCYQKEGSQPAIRCNPLGTEFSNKEIMQDDCKATTEETLNGHVSISSLSHSLIGHAQEGSLFNESAARSEVASVLFRSTNTGKRDMFVSRSFSSAITYDELVYAREGARSVRSSLGTSASSSADFTARSVHGFVRTKSTDVERQKRPFLPISKQKAEMEDFYVPLKDDDEASSSETNHLCDSTEVGSWGESVDCVTTCNANELGKFDSAAGIEQKSLTDVAAERGSSREEEESETVIFCNSLVNDLVYHLAVDKESSVLTENSRPGLTFTDRSNVGKGAKFEAKAKAESKTQITYSKGMSFDDKIIAADAENDENMNEAVVNKKASNNLKTPKIESKCNCTVM